MMQRVACTEKTARATSCVIGEGNRSIQNSVEPRITTKTSAIKIPRGWGIRCSPLAQVAPASKTQSKYENTYDSSLNDPLPAQSLTDRVTQTSGEHESADNHQKNCHELSKPDQHQRTTVLRAELLLRFFRSTSILNCSKSSHYPVSARISSWSASQS